MNTEHPSCLRGARPPAMRHRHGAWRQPTERGSERDIPIRAWEHCGTRGVACIVQVHTARLQLDPALRRPCACQPECTADKTCVTAPLTRLPAQTALSLDRSARRLGSLGLWRFSGCGSSAFTRLLTVGSWPCDHATLSFCRLWRHECTSHPVQYPGLTVAKRPMTDPQFPG